MVWIFGEISSILVVSFELSLEAAYDSDMGTRSGREWCGEELMI